MNDAFKKNSVEVLKELKTDRETGLTSAQVAENTEKYGKNQLLEEKRKGVLQVFLEQFKDLLVIILIIAALISLFTGEAVASIVIFSVIILNAILGTVQHFKAQKSLDSLKAMATPSAKVIRDGEVVEVQSSDLVPGDIVKIEAGDVVPADARVIESYSLQVNESALTGESNSIEKNTDKIDKDCALGDRINMVYSGSLVTYGRAVVVITATGMDTELGKIATLMNQTKERKTPLQRSLDDFSKKLSVIIMVICAVVLVISWARDGFAVAAFDEALLFAIALAVAAIPEALSSIVTISLAIGTSKMAKQNAIIKNLRAVEGLGCVSVICSDKTGTLTQNKMTVEGTFTFDKSKEEDMALYAILCNDSVVKDDKSLGDPTETALKHYYNKVYSDCNEVTAKLPRLGEIPFDSDRKLMSTVHELDGKLMMITKGAVDVLIGRMKYVATENGVVPVTDELIKQIEDKNNEYSENGLRVLAFAYKEVNRTDINLGDETAYTFLGLMCMIDPPREESAQAVKDCISAGIKPVMITGDHVTTASAIARKIGILRDGDKAITGQELDSMSDDDLRKEIKNISVYARVSPEHKIRIVSMWQELGNVVSMTGDGVNDAPALKKADIGIAMGITGTEVSKDAAAMILTDDNFATIIKAVANGRNIYANIKNSIQYLLSGNMAAIIVVLICSILGFAVPFTAVQLLFINLITDSLPAIAIGMEPASGELLKEKPRSANESLINKNFLGGTAIQGVLIAIATMIAFIVGAGSVENLFATTNGDVSCAMAFTTVCLARLWHGFNMRGKQSLIKLGIAKNPASLGAFAVGVILLSVVIFVPVVANLFNVVAFTSAQLIVILCCSLAPTLIIQITRMIKELIKK